MVRSKRRDSCFGAPADFSESQLPRKPEVGQQFLKTQLDLKLKDQNGGVTNHSVAKVVCNKTYVDPVFSFFINIKQYSKAKKDSLVKPQSNTYCNCSKETFL